MDNPTDTPTERTPITIPLSAFMRDRLHAMDAEMAVLTQRKNEAVSSLVAQLSSISPAQMVNEHWAVDIRDDRIVCTPPQDSQTPAGDLRIA